MSLFYLEHRRWRCLVPVGDLRYRGESEQYDHERLTPFYHSPRDAELRLDGGDQICPIFSAKSTEPGFQFGPPDMTLGLEFYQL